MQPHDFWQAIDPPLSADPGDFHTGSFPALLPDGRILHLPIRPLPDGRHGLASLIINQASFHVVEALASELAAKLQPAAPEIVVGLPTLGLTLAAAVARHLGHRRYAPLGSSRKFWYEDHLSVPMSSVTTPTERRLFVDPRLLPLIAGKRVALVDDVISTGTSIAAGIRLLEELGSTPVVIGCAMLQSERWRDRFGASAASVVGVVRSPLLERVEGAGWRAVGLAEGV